MKSFSTLSFWYIFLQRYFFSAFLTAVSAFIISASVLHAEEGSKDTSRDERKTGFYKGIFLMSGHSGAIQSQTGSVIAHDRAVDRSLVLNSLPGTSPLMFAAKRPYSLLYHMDPEYKNGEAVFFDLEYGISSHLGLGLTLRSGTLQSVRQEQFIRPEDPANLDASGNPKDPNKLPSFYTEVMPISRNFYKENALLLSANWHFLTQSRIDPYAVFRGGAGRIETFYRTGYNSIRDVTRQKEEGNSLNTVIGLGSNFMLTEEFGLKAEMNYSKSEIRTPSISNGTMDAFSVTGGVFLNWDGITRHSY